LDRKTASLENGYISSSALDEPIRTKKITRGYIYMLYNHCEDKLRNDFEKNLVFQFYTKMVLDNTIKTMN
jgi:hypothetical protein